LTSEELMELARQSVVRVRNTGCGELSVGSAWLADDGRMVSNQHVVEGVRGLEMSTWDGRDMTVASIEAADAADVSRVVATWPPSAALRPMSVRTTRVEPGERIAILGYPEGGELAVSTGVSMGYATDLELAPREILKLTNVVKPGNSGGPAVDQLGRVVGVVYAEEIRTDAALVVPITDAIGPTAVPMQPVLPCS
jgi:S1-C subfamily serine protease